MTKYLIEQFLMDLSQKKLMDLLILRYFNACGASPQGDLGENHFPETHLIPGLCINYFQEKKHPFYLFGQSHSTPDGTCIRDYIHVEDIAHAHYLGLQYLFKNSGTQIFNLGSEKGYSVREILNLFEKIAGKKTEVEVRPNRAGDPPRLIADMTKARKELGFELKYGLEDGLIHTLNWFRKKFHS